ncbi:hypothetical protein [Nocardioides sp. LS1]|uniref:hypothetical protein n=1 Tax=Nocardioides sp. LS1 TaxID=1027620 RepID=UPI000F618DFD|nr:hypothetical protein [Nocardioides sp. LS1]GCD89248.1 hypothetical protein NLS1_12540 [Nocardioides sp. LS1]
MTGTVRPRVAGMVLATLGLTLTSACGGSSEAKDAPVPACMQSLSPASVPSDGTFPKNWPFPPGTVVTATEEVPGGGLAVTAQVGSDFEKVLPFMQHDLEDAGFVATQGEAEHDDAEATWSGNGYAGTWAIRSSDTCEGTTLMQVAAAKQ